VKLHSSSSNEQRSGSQETDGSGVGNAVGSSVG